MKNSILLILILSCIGLQGFPTIKFCSSISKVIKNRDNRFFEIQSNQLTSNDFAITFKSTVRLMDAVENTIVVSKTGSNNSYQAVFGPFATEEEALERFNGLIKELLKCLKNHEVRYPYADYTKKEALLVIMHTDGYKPAGIEVSLDQENIVRLGIWEKPLNEFVNFISGIPKGDGDFITNLNKLIDASHNRFRAFYGEKKVSNDFMKTNYYKITVNLGESECIFELDGFGLGQPCRCKFNVETNKEAEDDFFELIDIMKEALGKDYVYIYREPWEGEIQGDVRFGKKSEIYYQKTPVVTVSMSTKYGPYLFIYIEKKDFFGIF